MRKFGFNFESLYYLDLATLYDVVQVIRGDQVHIALDYDVMIRGCIIPFLRHARKLSNDAHKDDVLRQALVVTAKRLKVEFEDWDGTDTDVIAVATRRRVRWLLAEKLNELDEKKRQEVLGVAQNNLKTTAKAVGVPLATTGAIVAGELSGFGVYLATTTGLHALSLALGTTFSWGVYQGATTLLGIVLGPVGWVVAGVSLAGGVAVAVRKWMQGKDERSLILTVIALLLALGENPFAFFELSPDALIEDVKRVYRAMMKAFHPDVRPKDLPSWMQAEFDEKLLRCQEAYEKLLRMCSEEGTK